jgi:hypothetical protein
MKWEEPSFEEIKMDAEIGSYQNDFDRDRDHTPVLRGADSPSEDRAAPAPAAS